MLRRSISVTSVLCVLLACVTAACGGSSSPAAPSSTGPTSTATPPPTSSATNGTFTATIDGSAFAAVGNIAVIYNNGILSMSGGDGRQVFALAVTVNRGPGTYQAGVIDPQNVVTSTLTPSGSAAQWVVGPTFGGGSVTLTSLTSTSASGTFSLTMAPSAGTGASGTKSVTNGIFNVTFTSNGSLPPGSGVTSGTLTALVDGVAWRGAVSARASITSGLLSVSGQDTDTRFITFVVPGNVGTYSLAYGNPYLANMNLGGQQWTTVSPGGTGSVTVTTLTGNHVTGTFTITFQPAGTNTPPRNPVQVTSGVFDLSY